MGRPRLHDQETERELLAAAEALLASEGTEGLTVRRLAEAAGTTSRAIYSLFGDKDGLVRRLFREAFVVLASDLAARSLTDDSRRDLVEAGAQGFRRWALAHPQLFRLVFEARPPAVAPEPEDSQAGLEAFEQLLIRVRRCREAGLIGPAPDPVVAMSFHALCEGLASVELRGRFPLRPDQKPEEVWAQALGALVDGFRP
jgi:AcrR family transcriptional regulator